ncbi:tRNA (mo5U34)-methyltransferase [Striga asiatica]|uniref:tRNA (Mo5U34)-methyltransferase n=1 Tax=Striga asiatica TaxID=4170 RepID=A0A5A7RH37_STRAF|nr:tRNA (mo5U34)-methyltransferase [Striga asiatica]
MALLAWHKPIHRNSEKAIAVLTAKLESTKISETNWILGIICRKPSLRVAVDGHLFWVKDLLLAGGVLFAEEDAERILKIKSLNPRVADQWQCTSVVKGKFSVKKAYTNFLSVKVGHRLVAESSGLK